LYAIGGNPDAARLSGINLKRYVLAAFCVMGALAGGGMVCEPEVVVGAEVDHLPIGRSHGATLRAGQHALGLVQALLPQASQIRAQSFKES
jgi:hypothetical protein